MTRRIEEQVRERLYFITRTRSSHDNEGDDDQRRNAERS